MQLFDASPSIAAYPEDASRRIWEGHPFPALPLIAR